MRAFCSLGSDLRCIVLGPVSSWEARSGEKGKSMGVFGSGQWVTALLSLLVQGLALGRGHPAAAAWDLHKSPAR